MIDLMECTDKMDTAYAEKISRGAYTGPSVEEPDRDDNLFGIECDARLDSLSVDSIPAESEAVDQDLVPVENAIELYLKQIAHVPLLSRDQEVELAIKLRDARQAQRSLQEGPCADEERRRLQAVIDAGLEARDHLIRANVRLVISVAKKYMNRGVPFLDLIQEGNIGLIKGVDRFDHTKGFRLSTYATWWIRQTVTRAIADSSRTIRLPVHMSQQIHQLYKVTQQLEQTLDRRPTPHEIADEMDMDVQRVRWMLDISRRSTSLQRPVGEDRDMELGAIIEDKSTPSPLDTASRHLLREQIEQALNTLSPREARILRMRFGLLDGYSYTLEEIGEKFGLTRERIRQLERDALHRLRHPRRKRILREYDTV